MSTLRLAALATAALACGACGFVQSATTDGHGVSPETLTVWIAAAETMQTANQPLAEESLRERDLFGHADREHEPSTCGFGSWDEGLDCLHA